MSYATTANRASPLAALGALGVPAAFGAILVAGLAVTGVIKPIAENPDAFDYPAPDVTVPLDPVEPVDTPSSNANASDDQTVLTRPDSKMDWELGPSAPIGELPGLDDGIGTGLDLGEFDIPDPRPTPMFNPIAAAPRGNPGDWIRTSDYRTSWINRGYDGVAGFTLQIDANGRISDCAITRSTGHRALDDATCTLLRDRARFDPAKDSSGNSVSGSYSSSVSWQIPD